MVDILTRPGVPEEIRYGFSELTFVQRLTKLLFRVQVFLQR